MLQSKLGMVLIQSEISMCLCLKRVCSGFPSTDTNRLFQSSNEDFSVTNFACVGSFGNGFDNLIQEIVRSSNFDFDFRKEVNHILCTAVQFCVTFLTTESFYFCHGNTLDTDLR